MNGVETTEAIASGATKAMYAGASSSILGWLMSSEFAVLVGLIVGVGGFFVNWYYRHQENKRQQAKWELEMSRLDQ